MEFPERVAYLATISISNEEKYANIDGHNQYVFLLGISGNKPISQVMVINGSAVI